MADISATLEARTSSKGVVRYRVGIKGIVGYEKRYRWITLPKGTTEREATDSKNELLGLARAGELVVDPSLSPRRNVTGGPLETVPSYFERWNIDRRDRRGLSSTDLDGYRFERYVRPFFDGVLMTAPAKDIQRRTENLVDDLDRRIASGIDDMKVGKTAVDVFHIVTRMFKDATKCKNRSLVVRRDNPTANVVGPERSEKKAKTILFPDELTRVLKASGSLRRKRTYALLTYLYLRTGELLVLGKNDVDPKRRLITVYRAWEARTKRVGPPKNGKTRTWQYEPEIAPLIEALLDEPTPDNYRGNAIPGGLLIEMPRQVGLAPGLRDDLRAAGVTRSAIFARGATVKNLTVHDLRASGITWRAKRGDNAYQIQAAAGHERFSETEGYIRLAQTYGDAFGEVFPPLPLEVLGLPYLARQVPWFGSQNGSHGGFGELSGEVPYAFPVPKEGLESSSNSPKPRETSATDTIPGPTAPPYVASESHGTQRGAHSGPTETQAVRQAIYAALSVGRYDIARQLSGELEQRTRPVNVTPIAGERKGSAR